MSRVALVTGGARRIGLAIATRLAKEGYELVLTYHRDAESARKAVPELLGAGARNVHLVGVDLAQPASRGLLLARTLELTGRLDLLVNSAALFEYDHALSVSSARLDRHLQTNFVAPTELTLAWARLREATGEKAPGHVVTLLDQKLDNLNPDYCSYTLSKLAAGASIRFLAQTCAPWLRVNAVSPGVTMPTDGMSSEDFQAARNVAALGKSSTPQDIAEAVWALEQLRAVTGQTLAVDGGQHLVPRRRDVAFPERPLFSGDPA